VALDVGRGNRHSTRRMLRVGSLAAVPLLSAADRLPHRPARVVVGGTSGSGKTTLARRIAATIGASHTEIDSLHHGPGARPIGPIWDLRAIENHRLCMIPCIPSGLI
jgi:hypothetical protein